MKTSTIILIIIAVAVVFGGGGYYLGTKKVAKTAATATATVTATTTAKTSGTATADVTADWKTYTNDEFHYSFKYPSEWVISSEKSSDENVFNLQYIYLDDKNGGQFQVHSNNPGFGVEWATYGYTGTISDSGKIIIEEKKVLAPSDIGDGITGAAILFGLKQNDNQFDVVYSFKVSNQDQSIVTFDQILSTFQFTK